MSIESLTYADLGGRLGTSPEAARALARRLRLPRTTGNDGKARVTVDLADIQYRPSPTRSPGGHRPDIDALNARIEDLRARTVRHHHRRGLEDDQDRDVGPPNRRSAGGRACRSAETTVVETGGVLGANLGEHGVVFVR